MIRLALLAAAFLALAAWLRLRVQVRPFEDPAGWTRSLDELPTADEDGVTWAGS